MDGKLKIWQLAALLVVYSTLAIVLPLADDEVYYWCWSKELQWSYYDHPPMTAVLIYLSTCLFGDTALGIRFPACVATAFTIAVISRLTSSRLLVTCLLFTPLFTFGSVLMTPDSPLILFWSAYWWWLVVLHQKLTSTEEDKRQIAETGADLQSRSVVSTNDTTVSLWFWTLGGVLLGCGVLSKYTMGLAVPTCFVSFLLSRVRWQRWLPGYVFHGVISFVVALPILIYNVTQNFEPLLYQWEHAAEKAANSWMSFGDFVGVQVLLFGTMPIVLLPWVIRKVGVLKEHAVTRVSWCLYAIPLMFFLYKSTQTRLQGNWALVCFLSFWPIASQWYESVKKSKTWQNLTIASFLPPGVAVAAILVHLIWPIPAVPIGGDRLYRQIALNRASEEIAEIIRRQNSRLPTYTGSYQMTSLLRFQSLDARQIDGMTRPSHFTRPPRHLTDAPEAFVVAETRLAKEFCEGFAPPADVGEVAVQYRGKTDRVYKIWRYTKQSPQALGH